VWERVGFVAQTQDDLSDSIPPAVESECSGVPQMYDVYYTLSFGHDAFIDVSDNFRCMRGTPGYLIQIKDLAGLDS